MPPAGSVLLPSLIDRHAEERPDEIFGLFEGGSRLTYGALRRHVRRCAAGLQALGVRQGDCVACWLPNTERTVVIMLALTCLGATVAPLNTGYRGNLLEHVLGNVGGRLLIADSRLLERLDDAPLAGIDTIVAVGGCATFLRPGIAVLPGSALDDCGDHPAPPPVEICPWDTLAIIYTSGTTGLSKGVSVSSLQVHANYLSNGNLRPEDRALIALPLFHMAGIGQVWTTLMRGGSFALIDSFRTTEFWPKVREFSATCTTLLGVMCSFLLKAPASPRDRDHTLTRAMCVPLSDQHREFSERFGVDIYTAWNMTETSSPLFAGPAPAAKGTCGRPRSGVEVRIVDANDCEVPVGEIGELMVRTDMPFAMSHGYHRNPEATSTAWRNGWFHTGDAFRKDAEGWFYFVDRMKDAIRRRGENISSFEVEREILAHAAIRDVAVVAVASEDSEDEVMAVVCLVPGESILFSQLIDFLRPRLAHFMIPRYYRVAEDLPRTPTNKVQKHLIRDAGLLAETWDRVEAGIEVRGDRLGRGNVASTS